MKTEQEIREEIKSLESKLKEWKELYNNAKTVNELENIWAILVYCKTRIRTLNWVLNIE